MSTVEDRRTMIIALAGATAISFAPLLYIRSDTTALTGAFYRMFYALPILGVLVLLSKRKTLEIKILDGLRLALVFY